MKRGESMPGFDLKEGRYIEKYVSDDELWSAFASLFSSQSTMVSSYKYGLLKAIIDNLYNTDEKLKLTFDQVFSKFAEIYWNLILKYRLKQQAKKETYLEQILHLAVAKYGLPEGIAFENLPIEIMVEIVHDVKQKCKIYVVVRYLATQRNYSIRFQRKRNGFRLIH